MKFNQETRTTISASTGMVKLASGEITTPVAYLDLSLPATYRSFRLSINDVMFSVHGFLAIVFSQDNGLSFINDPINTDSYIHTLIAYASNSTPMFNDTPTGQHFLDGVMGPSFFEAATGPYPADYNLEIMPGSTSFVSRILGQSSAFDPDPDFNPGHGMLLCSISVNPNATATPALKRANLIRILPSGNETTNPPTSGNTITSGSYILWGISA